MKIFLLSYATAEFHQGQHRLKKSALKFGVDQVILYGRRDLVKTKFYQEHKDILDQPRGGGYWLWKPFFILEAMKRLNPDDLLFYSDAGIEIVANLDPLISLGQKKGILLFQNGNYRNKEWTKRDCFRLMKCDQKKYWSGRQVMGGFQLYKKEPESLHFLTEWLCFCSDQRIISDSQNETGQDNLAGFREHRHDQSILSLLAIKHRLEIFHDPSQWGESLERLSNSPYDKLIFVHRQRNRVWLEEIKNAHHLALGLAAKMIRMRF